MSPEVYLVDKSGCKEVAKALEGLSIESASDLQKILRVEIFMARANSNVPKSYGRSALPYFCLTFSWTGRERDQTEGVPYKKSLRSSRPEWGRRIHNCLSLPPTSSGNKHQTPSREVR